ncbi:MAG TPA: GEVED domain-containing protein, partial [Anaerolineales bacterium]
MLQIIASFGIIAALVLPGIAALAAPPLPIIDHFDSTQSVTIAWPDQTEHTSSVADPNVLGGERDIIASLVGGTSAQSLRVDSNLGGDSVFSYSSDTNIRGKATLQWDGAGGATFNPTGLGGVDLTMGSTANQFVIAVASDDLPANLVLSVYTDANNWSSAIVSLPGGINLSNQRTFTALFSSFAQGSGASGPANFSNVGAVTLLIDGTPVTATGLDLTLDLIEVSGPNFMDFGDLPASYGITLLSENGARAVIDGLKLGTLIDAEPDGKPSPTANADLDDDGVKPTPGVNWKAGTAASGNGGSVDVTVNGCGASKTCFLSGWINWNSEGAGSDSNFTDTGEMVALDVPVTDGLNTVKFDIPAGVTFSTNFFSRWRLYRQSSQGTVSFTGQLFSGEVEDYLWSFGPTAVTLANLTARSNPTSPSSLYLGLLGLLGVTSRLGDTNPASAALWG